MVGRKKWFSTLSVPWATLKELPEKSKISALGDSDMQMFENHSYKNVS